MRAIAIVSLFVVTLVASILISPAGFAQNFEIVLVPRVVFVDGRAVVRLVPMTKPVGTPGSLPGLTTVDDDTWDNSAVRRVLHTFAFGGQARDGQINAWANMNPEEAIAQILNFNRHNLRLSRSTALDADGLADLPGSLRNLADFWSSNNTANPVPSGGRDNYRIDEWGSAFQTWLLAAVSRGLNPFQHKVGLWETNYHMSVNQNAGVSTYQIFKYYDDILNAHRNRAAYQDVMGVAAVSAAVAQQYGHAYNRYIDGVCYCNEDFAREIHQLFFGILGLDDPQYHEEVSIKNTAAALTDMNLDNREAPEQWQAAYIDFQIDEHVPGAVEILNESISGRTAKEKIENLVQIDIEHAESLDNLPVMIVAGLADDRLSEESIANLRRAWRSMEEKDLLQFLRAYAVSTMFHSPDRVKFLTSIDRHLLIANLSTHSNAEHAGGFAEMWRLLWDEEVRPFQPVHDVFGHQTGAEAAESGELFRKHYNSLTESPWRFINATREIDGRTVTKDWGAVAPRSGGRYQVSAMARWLWQRFIADGHENYGELEQAHLHALLATGNDIGKLAHPENPQVPVTADEVANDNDVQSLVADLGDQDLALNSSDADERLRANQRMGQAVSFIVASPFIFAQQGR